MKNKKIIKGTLAIALMLGSASFVSGCGEDDASTWNPNFELKVVTEGEGTIYGAGYYLKEYGGTIVAVPDEGYEFDKWSDGDTNPVKTIVPGKDVSSDVLTINAYFKQKQAEEVSKYYALDKVEVYAQKDGTITSKMVEYHSMKITNDDTDEIISNGASNSYEGIAFGQVMINESAVLVGSNAPLTFYSARNDSNVFEKDSTLNLSLNISYSCHSGYFNNYGEWIYDNNFSNHSVTTNEDLSFKITGETTKLVIIADESQHGYKIYAKLHFIEI